MSNELIPQGNEIILYTTPNGTVHIEVLFKAKPLVKSEKMAELFGVGVNTIKLNEAW